MDDDDFNVFVSPRMFGGRTPSAATARSRVFQDAAALEQVYIKHELEQNALRSAAVVSKGGRDVEGGAEPPNPRKGLHIWYTNVAAALAAAGLALAALFVAYIQRNAPAVALMADTTPVLNTPLYLSLAIALPAAAMLLYAALVRAAALAPERSDMAPSHGARASIVVYCTLVFLALAGASFALFASTGTLLALRGAASGANPSSAYVRIRMIVASAASAVAILTNLVVIAVDACAG